MSPMETTSILLPTTHLILNQSRDASLELRLISKLLKFQANKTKSPEFHCAHVQSYSVDGVSIRGACSAYFYSSRIFLEE